MSKASPETKPQLFESMASILCVLGNTDALMIFEKAKCGIKCSTDIIKELGLTQKRYYSRLRDLISKGLVEKTDEGYRLTILGEAIHNISYSINEILLNRDRLLIMNQLMGSNNLSIEEKKKIMKTLALKGKYLSLEELYGIQSVVKIIDSYDELVKTVIECFDRAQTEIMIASRYTVMELAERVYNITSKGVKINWIDGDKSNLSSKLQILKFIFMNPKIMKNFMEAVNSPNTNMWFYSDLPYSFMIIDGKFGALEINHPTTNEFLFAIFFDDSELCEKLNQIFHELKEKATEHPYKKLGSPFKKLKLQNPIFSRI
ncbi:MAG: hypothetical protein QXX08_02900 [Candidatus Bathyarchaeia archaeon]